MASHVITFNSFLWLHGGELKNFIIPKMEVNFRIHVYEWLLLTSKNHQLLAYLYLFMLPSLIIGDTKLESLGEFL